MFGPRTGAGEWPRGIACANDRRWGLREIGIPKDADIAAGGAEPHSGGTGSKGTKLATRKRASAEKKLHVCLERQLLIARCVGHQRRPVLAQYVTPLDAHPPPNEHVPLFCQFRHSSVCMHLYMSTTSAGNSNNKTDNNRND